MHPQIQMCLLEGHCYITIVITMIQFGTSYKKIIIVLLLLGVDDVGRYKQTVAPTSQLLNQSCKNERGYTPFCLKQKSYLSHRFQQRFINNNFDVIRICKYNWLVECPLNQLNLLQHLNLFIAQVSQIHFFFI